MLKCVHLWEWPLCVYLRASPVCFWKRNPILHRMCRVQYLGSFKRWFSVVEQDISNIITPLCFCITVKFSQNVTCICLCVSLYDCFTLHFVKLLLYFILLLLIHCISEIFYQEWKLIEIRGLDIWVRRAEHDKFIGSLRDVRQPLQENMNYLLEKLLESKKDLKCK
jgi:hypothetical protein